MAVPINSPFYPPPPNTHLLIKGRERETMSQNGGLAWTGCLKGAVILKTKSSANWDPNERGSVLRGLGACKREAVICGGFSLY